MFHLMFSESDKYMFSDGSKPLGKKKTLQGNNDKQWLSIFLQRF